MSNLSTEEVDALIASSRRLVQDAKEAVARSRQFFAEQNIDPQEALEFVRQHGGDAAVQAIEAKVKAAVQSIEEEAARRQMHTPKARPAGQRARMRSNMV